MVDLEVEKRRDLDEAADGRSRAMMPSEQDDRVLLEDGVFVPERHVSCPHSAGSTRHGCRRRRPRPSPDSDRHARC